MGSLILQQGQRTGRKKKMEKFCSKNWLSADRMRTGRNFFSLLARAKIPK
jgi:hypothetical protein